MRPGAGSAINAALSARQARDTTMADNRSTTGMPLPDAVAGNFQEAVRWFNQMWGGAGDAAARSAGPIPSVLMPTLDIKELDKRIADLRSVEHWLQLNQGLLQTTIQGLEMQRNTLSAWQSFGAAASAGAGTTEKPREAAGAPEAPPFQPAMWWAALQQQFAQMAAAAAAGEAPAPSAAPGDAPPADAPARGTPGKAAGGKGRSGASGAG